MSLTGIFDAWAQHRADRKEFERQIARQVLMLNPNKVVAKDAFNLCCFPDGYMNTNPNSFIEKQFDKYEWGAMFEYNKKVARGEEEKYPIPAQYIPDHVRQSVMRSEPDKGYYDGALLGNVLDSWDALAWNDQFLDKLGRKAFQCGQGQAMIDFWKTVNDLDDYSHLFPGGGKRQKGKGNRVTLSAPSFVVNGA